MRKLFCVFLIFTLLLPSMGVACGDTTNPDGFVPSPTIESLYSVGGPVEIFENSKFDYVSMLKGSFSENIIDCIPLIFILMDEESRSVQFDLAHPSPMMWAFDCFIVDADGNLIGNVTCEYLECTCGEWWYDVNVTAAPGKYQSQQVVYLVWVE